MVEGEEMWTSNRIIKQRIIEEQEGRKWRKSRGLENEEKRTYEGIIKKATLDNWKEENQIAI